MLAVIYNTLQNFFATFDIFYWLKITIFQSFAYVGSYLFCLKLKMAVAFVQRPQSPLQLQLQLQYIT